MNNLNDVVENICYFLWRHDSDLRVLRNSIHEFIIDFISWPGPVKDSVSDLIWHTSHDSIERSIRDATRDYFKQNER